MSTKIAMLESLLKAFEHTILGTQHLDDAIHMALGVKRPRLQAFVSSDITATLGLIDRVLPGWTYTMCFWPTPLEAVKGETRFTLGGPGYISDDSLDDTFEVIRLGNTHEFALAGCTALIQAVLAQEKAIN
jgi:hypothetical protein